MNLTLKEAYNKYIDYVVLKCKPQSIRSIKSRFNSYILPYLGDKKIKDIDALCYLEWQIEIDKKGFSYKYNKALHYSMVSLFNFCITFLDVQKNIPSCVGNFKKKYETSNEIVCWNINEYYKFISVADNQVYKTLFNFLYFTGCRIGEALALTFNDISDNVVSINKTISKEYINGARMITSPKTKKSIRKIHIDNALLREINLLKNYYSTKNNNINNLYVFGGLKPLAPTTVTRYKNLYCELAGVRQIRLHDFRHSHATLLITNNVPINDISERLGHSNINTTLETYIHSNTDNEKRVLETLESLRTF